MRIAVCIKQVPASQEGRMDAQTGVLIRDGGTCINPYDLYALENALRLREQLGGSIVVFTMGPASAVAVLREAYALGVDDGVLICDPAFRGADVLATSYTLAQAIKTEQPFDLIICGRQTTDGDTAQVGPALAAQLDIPCASWVEAVLSADEVGVTVCQSQSYCHCNIHVDYPCVLCVEQESVQPRLPSLKLKLGSAKKSVRTVVLSDFDNTDPERFGLKGSPTRVKKIFTPQATQKSPILTGEPEELAVRLVCQLSGWTGNGKGGTA
ncbi:MAG: electron transfer flavoprotein subunit beta/FixA family protein [Angelakisella sp.]